MRLVPAIVNLELTNRCNLECVFCDHATLKRSMRKGDMSVETLETLLSGLGGTPVYELGLVGLGEPMLDKLLEQHLKIIHRWRQLFTRISLNSNAVTMTEAKSRIIIGSDVNMVTFSLNATNRASYRQLMKADKFDQAVANIRRFLLMLLESARPNLKVSIQFMSSRLNTADEMQALFADYLSDDVIVYDRHVFHKPALDQEANNLVNINPAGPDKRYPCWSMYSRVYIDIEGNVYPCTIGNDSYREKGDLLIGNVAGHNIVEIFNGARIQRARQDAENGGLPFAECRSCTIWQLLPNNFYRKSTRWARADIEELRRAELDRED